MTTSTSTAPHDGSNRTGRTAEAGPEFVIHEPRGSKPATWMLGLAHQDRVVRWSLPYGLPDRSDVDQPAIQVGDRLRHFIDLDGLDEEATEPTSLAVWDRGSLEVGSWRHDRIEVQLRGGKVDGAFAIARDRDDHWIVHLSGPTAAAWEELPNVVLPMSASVGHPRDPEPAAWYEPCWRGLRARCRIDGGQATVVNARGTDHTERFPELRAVRPAALADQLLLDGVIVVLDANHQLDHAALEARLRAADAVEAKRLSLRYPATFLAVDLLHQNGRCLLPFSAAARRARLEALGFRGAHWATTPAWSDRSLRAALDAAGPVGLDRVVAKRIGSAYRPGTTTPHWQVMHRAESQPFLIGAWRSGASDERPLDTLWLGVHRPTGGFQFAGAVHDGLDRACSHETRDLLERHSRVTSPFEEGSAMSGPPRERGLRWVSPVVAGDVEFTDWPADGLVQRAYGFGPRDDLEPDAVVRRP